MAGGVARASDSSWRTVDIMVVATIAVAFGVIFWAWNLVWAAAEPLFLALPPARNLLYGVWLIPAVLAGLVVRKPGAAIFAELVAASVSALIGSQWGVDTLLSGFVQGLAAETVFALARYRRWDVLVAAAAGIAAAVAAWLHDVPLYYPDIGLGAQLVIGVFMAASAVVIAGLGSHVLLGSLARAGVLGAFAAGRTQEPV